MKGHSLICLGLSQTNNKAIRTAIHLFVLIKTFECAGCGGIR